MVGNQIIEVEAESLEAARSEIKSRIPKGMSLLSEKVISDGKPITVKAISDTIETAFAKAYEAVPRNGSVIEKKELSTPDRKIVSIVAFDETGAISQTKQTEGAVCKAIRLTATGKKGFLGFGQTPNTYEAEVFQQAVVEIIYKTKVKISAEIYKNLMYMEKYKLVRQLQSMGRSLKQAEHEVGLEDLSTNREQRMAKAATFLVQNNDALKMTEMNGLVAIQLYKNIINSNFSKEHILTALQHRDYKIRTLMEKFISEISE